MVKINPIISKVDPAIFLVLLIFVLNLHIIINIIENIKMIIKTATTNSFDIFI